MLSATSDCVSVSVFVLSAMTDICAIHAYGARTGEEENERYENNTKNRRIGSVCIRDLAHTTTYHCYFECCVLL